MNDQTTMNCILDPHRQSSLFFKQPLYISINEKCPDSNLRP